MRSAQGAFRAGVEIRDTYRNTPTTSEKPRIDTGQRVAHLITGAVGTTSMPCPAGAPQGNAQTEACSPGGRPHSWPRARHAVEYPLSRMGTLVHLDADRTYVRSSIGRSRKILT